AATDGPNPFSPAPVAHPRTSPGSPGSSSSPNDPPSRSRVDRKDPKRMPLLVDPHNVYAADGAGDFSPAVRGIKPRVYVPNTLDGTLSVSDPTNFKVVKTITVGGQPHHVTPSWNLRHLYVD